MQKTGIGWIVGLSLVVGGWLVWTLLSRPPEVSYNADVRPILNERCITCHGGIKQNGGVSFLFREEALDTTESGAYAVLPGRPGRSEVIRRITHPDPEERMPPESPPLSDEEIQTLRRWIDQGAEWETHWAYIPPDPSLEPSKVEDEGWSRTGIDRFVYAALQEHGLQPNPPADKPALLRRVSLDLTGLPPDSALQALFLENDDPDAYERVVDTLLASPHFGERWAAMWLDLARYADSKGYEKDLDRSIWKYRDWVIRAFNRDLPFDRFTIEQLAGDLLPEPTADQLIATAYHRNSMANDEGGTDNEEFRVAAVLDRVGNTFEVWQGTTMACVQCHSHPYDPIRHEDFYRVMAFLNTTEDRDIYHEGPNFFSYEGETAHQVETMIGEVLEVLGDEAPPLRGRFLHEQKSNLLYDLDYRKEEAELFYDTSDLIEQLLSDQSTVWQIQDDSWITFADVDLTDVTRIDFRCATPLSGGYIRVHLDSVGGPQIGQTEVTQTGPEWEDWVTERPDEATGWQWFTAPVEPVEGRRDVYFRFFASRDSTSHLFHFDQVFYREATPQYARYGSELERMLETLYDIQPVPTPIIREQTPDERRPTQVFERGNWLTPAGIVEPGLPEAFGRLPEDAPRNRLGLARWLVSEENPLTARVIVNRFWAQLFGTGLVETVEDFGTQGARPSHPELLDWLAVRFRDTHAWSVKALLREIVTSATYRQSSHLTPEQREADPNNRLLARGPRYRLSAEQIRDEALAATGLLNRDMFGPSVKVPRPDHEPDEDDDEEIQPEDAYRRVLYTHWRRTDVHPFMLTFDTSDRTLCTSRRIRTNTPLQALLLLNDPVYFDAARALARQMQEAADTPEAQIMAGYQTLLLHPPDSETRTLFREAYDDALAHYTDRPEEARALTADSTAQNPPLEYAALTVVANAMLNVDAFVTKN